MLQFTYIINCGKCRNVALADSLCKLIRCARAVSGGENAAPIEDLSTLPEEDKRHLVLAGIDEGHLLQAVDTAVEMNRNGDYGIPVPDYIEENVSSKVVKIIQSYTGVVNKMVWRKEM